MRRPRLSVQGELLRQSLREGATTSIRSLWDWVAKLDACSSRPKFEALDSTAPGGCGAAPGADTAGPACMIALLQMCTGTAHSRGRVSLWSN